MTSQHYPASSSSAHLNRRALLTAVSGALLASALGSSILAATPATPPDSGGAGTLAELDAILASGIENGLPGIAVAVERGGTLVYSSAAGVASIESQVPLKASDRFRIYSITKTFTAIVVLQLVDEGVLTLDDRVTDWLDDPAVGRIPDIDRVTVGHLLRHTSGIYDFMDDSDSPFWDDAFLGPQADWAKVWTIDELLAYADQDNHASYFPPGTSDHYSNTNYLLLGMIAERASGRTFRDELQSRILAPLDLRDTELAEGGNMPAGTVNGYHLVEGEPVNISASNLSWIWTAGAIVSTTEDVLRFARAVLSGALLSDASFAEMMTFAPTRQAGMGDLAWGMGLDRMTTLNGQLTGMDGGSAGFTSTMTWHDEADVIVVALTNLGNDRSLSTIRDAVMAWTLGQPA